MRICQHNADAYAYADAEFVNITHDAIRNSSY
jgi:hypothetical protein